MGLVHRDIKPANIMLNRRGGESDVVKVLDFGLVKAIDEENTDRESGGGLSGTPLYMPPEAIETPDLVDARSDLYAVGAVGYFLLTGEPVFNAGSLAALLHKHVSEDPEPPSRRMKHPLSGELESAIMACLEKSRAKRPQTARDLMTLLKRSPSAGAWSTDDADAWWGRHERGDRAAAVSKPQDRPAFSGPATGTSASVAHDTASPFSERAKLTGASEFDRTIAFQDPNEPSGS